MQTDLFKILDAVLELPMSLQTELAGKMKHESFKKNAVILRPGEVNNKLFFIQRGLLRAYFNEDGKDITSWFRGEGEFAVSIPSFYGRRPSFEFIETLEYTEVFNITYDALFQTYRSHYEFSFIGLVKTIEVLVEWDETLRIIRTLESQQRFEWFMSKKAHLLDRITAKDLASYLGMTPETLSRVRRQFFRAA